MSENIQALPASDAPHSDSLRLAKRKKLFALLGASLPLARWRRHYWTLVASHHVSTDNAYVAVEMAQITPEVSGTVREVLAVDTQQRKARRHPGKLDDSDAKLNLAQAEAELARAERRVQGYLASDEGLQAQIQARIADQARSNAQLASARADLQRAELDLSAARPWPKRFGIRRRAEQCAERVQHRQRQPDRRRSRRQAGRSQCPRRARLAQGQSDPHRQHHRGHQPGSGTGPRQA
jgi:membrane fusion protein (multidrug efflux system)